MHDLAHVCFTGAEPSCPPRPRLAATPRPARPAAPRPRAAEPTLDPFLEWLLRRAGLNPAAYRASALHRRLPACLRLCRATSSAEARRALGTNARLLPATLDRVLIGVSAFFRDPKVFAALRDLILPDLLRTRTALRVCSVGAADGQELVSVAILLAESGALGGADLLGIDCRAGAIRRARAGIYDEESLLTLAEPRFLRAYFLFEDGTWRVRPELQRALRWQQADALAYRDPQPWDLILFRNLAIYLQPEQAAGAWLNLAQQLAPGGCIVATAAEAPPPGVPLQRVTTAIYRRSER